MSGGSQVRTRYQALDSWRGLAAVLVMLFHMQALTHFRDWPIIRNGHLAVSFFFVLSGFVIAAAYGDRLGRGFGFRRFALRRIGRLYPLHLAALGLYLVIQILRAALGFTAFEGAFSPSTLALNLLLVQAFTAHALTWNYPAWSISVELWMNLGLGLWLTLAPRRGAQISVFVFGLAAVWQVVRLIFELKALPPDLAEGMRLFAEGWYAFLLGLGVHAAFRRAQAWAWRPGPVAEAAAAALILSVLSLGGWLVDREISGLLTPPAFALAVFVFAYDAGPLSRWMRSPLPTQLGTVSYSIYLTHTLYLMGLEAGVEGVADLLHQPFLTRVGGLDMLSLGGPWVMDLAAMATVLAAVVGSGWTYRLIEDPARRLFNRWSGPTPASVAYSAAS